MDSEEEADPDMDLLDKPGLKPNFQPDPPPDPKLVPYPVPPVLQPVPHPVPPLLPKPVPQPSPQPSSTRTRKYPVGAKGPFVVYFRRISKPLQLLLISAELHSQFTSVKEISRVNNFKFRAVLAKREEANQVVELKRFQGLYRVYIPCDLVEIDGVIYDESLTPQQVIDLGEGKFCNSCLPSVSILECERLTMLDDAGNRVASNAMRVTFAGTMLPDYVCVEKVLIPVRLYSPKIMLCKRCNVFGHTEKYCTNKVKCIKCGEDHESSVYTKTQNSCILCKNNHDTLTACKAYQDKKKEIKNKIASRSKASFAEMLKATDPSSVTTSNGFSLLENAPDGADDDLSNPAHCSYNPPKKRKNNAGSAISKSAASEVSKGSSKDSVAWPMLQKTKDVPGFQKCVEKQETNDSGHWLTELLNCVCELLNVGPVWRKLIESLAPLLSMLWDKVKSLLPLSELLLSGNGQK